MDMIFPILFLAYLAQEYHLYNAPKYVALGDSLTVGLGALWGCGYTRLYYKWLASCMKYRALRYCNLGVNGWTSDNLLYAIKHNCNYRSAIMSAAIITLDIGGNDILRHKYSPAQLQHAAKCFQYNLYSILHEIRCLNSCAPIYLMDIYNPYPQCHPLHEIAEAWVTQFNSIIWNTLVISDFQIAGIASAYKAFKGNEHRYTFIQYDNVHPNTLGYRAMYESFRAVTSVA